MSSQFAIALITVAKEFKIERTVWVSSSLHIYALIYVHIKHRDSYFYVFAFDTETCASIFELDALLKPLVKSRAPCSPLRYMLGKYFHEMLMSLF